jgi:hypothetical protein
MVLGYQVQEGSVMRPRSLLVSAAFVLQFTGCGSDSTTTTPTAPAPTAPAPVPSASPTPALSLPFSDDFDDRRELGSQWTSGGSCDPASGGPPGDPSWPEDNSIVVIGGKVRSTANCNFIQTRARFGGDIRVAFDVEKVGSSSYPCWDFFVEVRGLPAAAGSILFDYGGRDAVRLGPGCADGAGIDGSSPNLGRAVLTVSGGSAQFTFTNERGDALQTGTSTVGGINSAAVRIWLAGASNSPRYVDNVRIYASTVATGRASASGQPARRALFAVGRREAPPRERGEGISHHSESEGL